MRQILQNTAEDLGSSGWDSWYGYGLVNAAEGVDVASPGTASGNVEEPPVCVEVKIEKTPPEISGGLKLH